MTGKLAALVEEARKAGIDVPHVSDPDALAAALGEALGYDPDLCLDPAVPMSVVRLMRGVSKAVVSKPLGRWADFDACVIEMTGKLRSAEAARRYCGKLQSLVE